MIYSNEHKLYLSGWFKENSEKEYSIPLKLQKFLFFYEAFTKADGENPDFDHLRGYINGPVFSNVWGDYSKNRNEFDKEATRQYSIQEKSIINEDRAQRSAFVVKTLSQRELSEFTHKMNVWSSKKERILSGEQQVPLEEKDFTQEDCELIKMLEGMYPMDIVKNSKVLDWDNHFFVLSNEDAKRLTMAHLDTLSGIAAKEELFNPVYVEIDEKGTLIID